jgi:hypothetical protein
MKTLSFMVVAAIALQSCTSESRREEMKPPADTAAAEHPSDAETKPEKKTDPNVRQLAFPATISDENLDRFFDEKTAKTVSEEQKKTLQLNKLENIKGSGYYILGEFDLSDQFTTRLILRNSNWTETVGWLANYDPDGKLIDQLEVFYSDNVEGYHSIASRIDSGHINVKRQAYDYTGEEEELTTTETRYDITTEGWFVKQK